MLKSGNAYRFSGQYSVELPTVPSLTARPSILELHQAVGQHDIAVLTFPNYRPVWGNLLTTGTPIVLLLSNGESTLRWTGYVNFTSQVNAAQLKRPTKIYCIGSSFPLKNRGTRVFSNTSIPDAVGVIAKELGLNFVGEPHPRVFNQLSISGESYWQWIQAQAARIGYIAIVEGANLLFQSIDRTLDSRMSYVPLYSLDGNLINSGLRNLRARTLDSFQVLQGDYSEAVEEPRTSKSVATVDLASREVIQQESFPQEVGSPIRAGLSDTWFAGYETEETVGNQQEADRAAQDAAQRVRLTTTANLKGFGDPRVGVYSTVLVSGTGNSTDGYWAVAEAHHRIDLSGLYTVDAQLLTDGLGNNAGSTFRRKFEHNKAQVDIRSRLASIGNKPLAGTVLKAPIRVLSTSITATNRPTSPGQWIAD